MLVSHLWRHLALCSLLILCALSSASAQGRALTEADLSPIPVGQNVAALREQIALGHYKEALQWVTGKSPEAHFVRGWLFKQIDDNEAALQALKRPIEALPLLADLARMLSAQAAMGLERWAPMGNLVRPLVLAEGPQRLEATRFWARAMRELKQPREAEAAYQRLLDSQSAQEVPVALLGLARLASEAGQDEQALDLLKRLDLTWPHHWAAKAAQKDVQEILKRAPQRAAQWRQRSVDEQLARAAVLSERGAHDAVIEALSPLQKAKMSADQRCQQRYYLGRSQRMRRQNAPALENLEAAAHSCEQATGEAAQALAPWARYLAGRANERVGQPQEGLKHYEALQKRHGAHRLADDGGLAQVRYLLDEKRDIEAARAHATALAKRFPEGDTVPEALFRVSLALFQAKKYAQAEAVLALSDQITLPEGFRDAETGQARYWRGRFAWAQKKKAQAIEHWARIFEEAPLSWYALLAYSRLREVEGAAAARSRLLKALKGGHPLRGWEANSARWSTTLPAKVKPDLFESARLLARLGLPDLAQQQLRAAGVQGAEGTWIAAWLLDRAGAWHLSHDLLRRQLWGYRWLPTEGPTRLQWEVAFPRPFGPLVRSAGAETGVDPHFIWAVMREESGFNPKVESWAQAVGLLQLLVGTGEQMRDKKKEPKKITRDRLTIPAVNVPLGARYLAHVKKNAKVPFALVPAGYNAGAGALSRWVKARGALDLDLFVELIPYDEARGYTKRVISSWATYRVLYAADREHPIPYISQRIQ